MPNDMMLFFSGMLGAVANFVLATPIIYLFGVILLLYAIKAFKMIIS